MRGLLVVVWQCNVVLEDMGSHCHIGVESNGVAWPLSSVHSVTEWSPGGRVGLTARSRTLPLDSSMSEPSQYETVRRDH